MDPKRIRNFSIIAHIDHGKSTLADRILELTGAVDSRDRTNQILDDMDLERERGITIKARAVCLRYKSKDGEEYQLNLIDTPGHVDFTYEVSRSLAACEGALLVVDAAQGVEAQTLANAYLALENDLHIIPVINKIDLPSADTDRTREQIEHIVGLDPDECIETSAKTGQGAEEILESVIKHIPPPSGDAEGPLRAMIFDSWHDPYRGAMILVRVVDGEIHPRMKIRMLSTGRVFEVEEVGVFSPGIRKTEKLALGEVGYVSAGIKKIREVQVGDTITVDRHGAEQPLPGFRESKPMVFAGVYPVEGEDVSDLRTALDKLQLNDSSLFFEPETSSALGHGFRCGFLGLLHMEIVQSRLEREFDVSLITTAPGVRYRAHLRTGETKDIENPAQLPMARDRDRIEEPIIEATIITPDEYLGTIYRICEERRGVQKKMEYLSPRRVLLLYELPLNEVVFDFHDKLKSVSRGYASFDYQHAGFRGANLERLDILVNGEPVDALATIVHKDKSYERGRGLTEKLQKLIPRQLFEVIIQASVGSRIIARESVRPLRKDVIAKCYGGDVTRKRKLLEKQKAGKKRMKTIGRIDIPQEAFLSVLRAD